MKKIQLAVFGLAMMYASGIVAHEPYNDKKKKEAPKEEKKEEDKFSDITKKCKKSDGLFTLWRDTTSGRLHLL
jgi:hypothetical protein